MGEDSENRLLAKSLFQVKDKPKMTELSAEELEIILLFRASCCSVMTVASLLKSSVKHPSPLDHMTDTA